MDLHNKNTLHAYHYDNTGSLPYNSISGILGGNYSHPFPSSLHPHPTSLIPRVFYACEKMKSGEMCI